MENKSKEQKDCNCKTKYCSHFTSDFDNFCKDNPLSTPPESWLEEFRTEYKKAYRGFFSEEVLEQGNPWFENFIRQTLAAEKAKMVKEIIGELESNPNEDGSESPNIVHWVEQKQIQLRRLFINPSEQEEKK